MNLCLRLELLSPGVFDDDVDGVLADRVKRYPFTSTRARLHAHKSRGQQPEVARMRRPAKP
jgi:hypothetical protein